MLPSVLHRVEARVAVLHNVTRTDGGIRISMRGPNTVDTIYMPGLTEQLRALFYAHYRRPRAPSVKPSTKAVAAVAATATGVFSRKRKSSGAKLTASKQRAALRAANATRAATSNAQSLGQAMREGLERGNAVHRMMQQYVAQLDYAQWFLTHPGEPMPDEEVEAREAAFWRSVRRERHQSLVRRIVATCKARHWALLYSELPVFDMQRFGRATMIDLVAWDMHRQRLVLLELKTGYDGVFEMPGASTEAAHDASSSSDNMLQRHPTVLEGTLQEARIDNSPLNQARLQLVASAIMFGSIFGDIVPWNAIDLCVLHVTAYGVENASAHPIPEPLRRTMVQGVRESTLLSGL